MVVGDSVGELAAVAEGDNIFALPPAGAAWEITNVYVTGGTVRMELISGSASLTIGDITASQFGLGLHLNDATTLTLTAYIGDAVIGYDGIVTRSPPVVFA